LNPPSTRAWRCRFVSPRNSSGSRSKERPPPFKSARSVEKLSELGGPLVELNVLVDWEAFHPDLSRVHDKARKSNAGAKL